MSDQTTPAKKMKFYVRCGTAFQLAPVVTASSARDAAVESAKISIMRIYDEIRAEMEKIGNENLSNDEINKISVDVVNKYIPKKKILVSQAGTEKLEEHIEDLRTRLGVKEEDIPEYEEMWKNSHKSDVFFDYGIIRLEGLEKAKKIFMDKFKKNGSNDSFDMGFDMGDNTGGSF